ncbi:MAG: hypothetical protein PVH84_14000 [Candidatus Aminicenantes bacterium]
MAVNLVFSDGKTQIITRASGPELAEEKMNDIFTNGWSYKSGNTTYYYPASSILKAQVTYYAKMEPDKK